MPKLNLTIIEVAFNDGAMLSIGNAARMEVGTTTEMSIEAADTGKVYSAQVVVYKEADTTKYRLFVHLPANEGGK